MLFLTKRNFLTFFKRKIQLNKVQFDFLRKFDSNFSVSLTFSFRIPLCVSFIEISMSFEFSLLFFGKSLRNSRGNFRDWKLKWNPISLGFQKIINFSNPRWKRKRKFKWYGIENVLFEKYQQLNDFEISLSFDFSIHSRTVELLLSKWITFLNVCSVCSCLNCVIYLWS